MNVFRVSHVSLIDLGVFWCCFVLFLRAEFTGLDRWFGCQDELLLL